jgi:alkylation response protein AidB-like acyl-CoA dehydrogenase
MDLELSPDQESLRDELRRFLETRVSPEARRACAEQPGAVDRDLWADLGSMGVFSLRVPEADGGVGLGWAEAAIVFEELGRAVVPGPLLATHLAAGLIDGAAAGEVVVGAVDAAAAPPVVLEHPGGLDAVLVVADESVSRAEPPPDAMPLDRPLDPLTPVAVLGELPEGSPVGGADLAVRIRRTAALLAAAQQVGLGQAAVDLGAGYARERTQFGRPIGSFQAVKHLLADAHVDIDVARAAVHAAAVELDEAGGNLGEPARTCGIDAARIVASRAAARATAACVQVHGGMGYTWEVDAHLLLKRVAVLDAGLGTSPEAALEARAEVLAAGS